MKKRSLNKVVLITGGTRGIGKACVLAFAQLGYKVAFTYLSNSRKAVDLQKGIRKLGGDVLGIKVDNSRTAQIKKMLNRVLEKFGHIDVLVNNAGIAEIKNVEAISEDDWDRIMDTNLKGTFFCSQLVFSHMKRRKWGRIINMSSQAGTSGGFFIGAHYAASIGVILSWPKTFAKLGASFGVLVNTVSPGLVETDMVRSFSRKIRNKLVKNIPVGRMAEPLEIAKVVTFLASDDAGYITGANIPVNGGMLMV